MVKNYIFLVKNYIFFQNALKVSICITMQNLQNFSIRNYQRRGFCSIENGKTWWFIFDTLWLRTLYILRVLYIRLEVFISWKSWAKQLWGWTDVTWDDGRDKAFDLHFRTGDCHMSKIMNRSQLSRHSFQKTKVWP